MPYTVDKWKELHIGQQVFFLPWALHHDLWHFDLFEYENDLYMVSAAEWGDNIMLSKILGNVELKKICVKTLRIPLINNHASLKTVRYIQKLYKPTAMIRNGYLYLYYTANSNKDYAHHLLFLSKYPMADLAKRFHSINTSIETN